MAPVSAQNCTVSAVPTTVRSESYGDLQGDIVLTCTQGVPTAPGQPVPKVTLTVTTQAAITSKITDAVPTNPAAFTEALLLIDDPNRNKGAAIQGNPVLVCGSPAAPYDAGNPGVCTINGTGFGGGALTGTTYNGTSGHPNVFQGRLLPNSGNSGIQFVDIPFDSPQGTDTLTIRITNIRLNVAGFTGGSLDNPVFPAGQISSQVAVASPSSVFISSTQVQTALARNGLINQPTVRGVGPYQQCGALPTDGGSVSITEGFPSSFKTKNWAQMQANGVPNAFNSLVYNGGIQYPVDLNQNVPGTLYSTESGFMFPNAPLAVPGDPSPNAPLGRVGQGQAVVTSTQFPAGLGTGIDHAGIVTNGTRIAFVFSTMPTGSNATVPSVINLVDSQAINNVTGVMVAVKGTDANGAGGTPVGTNTPISLSETASTTVVYEILYTDKDTIEMATVPITLAPTSSVQTGVTATVQAGFAPFYPTNASPNPGLPQPSSVPEVRFLSKFSEAAILFSFKACTPDLTITKTHVGNFKQGQNGNYTITVSNAGQGATSGTVTASDTLPTGLSGVSAAGTGWTCAQPAGPCSRSDALAGNAAYPPITLTVKAAADAPSSVINVATVSGGGDVTPASNSASDPTTITAVNPADLTISKSHVGNFVRGANGPYTILVTNAGGLPTTGKVTVTENLPVGLSLVSMTGTGWQCSAGSCSRTDVLATGAIYPPINVTVQVASGALTTVTNVATVSGGGETNTSNDTASDPTVITSPTASDLTISSAHDGNFIQTQNGATYTITVTNVGTAATNGLVTVVDNVPNGLKATAISGPGWKCQQPSGPCTRNSPLQPSANYPDLTLTVNVLGNAPATVVNQVAVAGGGEVNTANDSGTDSTTITPRANIIYSGRRNIVLKGVKGKNLTQIIHLAGEAGSWDALQLGISADDSGGGSNDIWAGAEVALAVNGSNRVQQFDSGDTFPKKPTFINGSAILWGFGTGSGDGDYFAAMKFGTSGGGPAYTGWIHLRIQNSSATSGTITVVDWAYSDQVSQPIEMGQKGDSKRDDPRDHPRGCEAFRRQDCNDSSRDDDLRSAQRVFHE